MVRFAASTRTARTTRTSNPGRDANGAISSGGGDIPVITAVTATVLSDSEVRIDWNTTGTPTTSQVHYGTTAALGTSTTLADTPAASAGVVSHSVTITGLTDETTYHYRPESSDGSTTVTVAIDTFTTTATPAEDEITGMVFSAMTLTPTYEKIGMEQKFSGDDDATCSVPFSQITTTAVRAGGATTLAVSALPMPLLSNSELVFLDAGVVKWATTSADAAAGATSLTVSALAVGIGSGATAYCSGFQFKKTADPTWRMGLQPIRTDIGGTDDGNKRVFFGSALLLDPATAYSVRVTYQRGAQYQVETGSATTWTDNISDHATLLAAALADGNTLFVDPLAGSDLAAGTVGVPWQTFDKAQLSAASGRYVVLEPGSFQRSTRDRTTAVTYVTRYPVVVNDTTRASEADTSRHSIIYGHQIAPSGTAASGSVNPYTVGNWTEYTTPAGHSAWKMDNAAPSVATIAPSTANYVSQIGYHDTRASLSSRLPSWRIDNGANYVSAVSADDWINLVSTNLSQNYGFMHQLGTRTLWMILPPQASSLDPNDLWFSLGMHNEQAMRLNGPNQRVSGVRVDAHWTGIHIGHGSNTVRAADVIVDHCLVNGCFLGTRFEGKGNATDYPRRITCQYNLSRNTNTWSEVDNDNVLAWEFIKDDIYLFGGGTYHQPDLGGHNECSAYTGRNHFQNVVIRHCTVDGYFNGMQLNGGATVSSAAPYTRDIGRDCDVHDCVITNIADDPIETDYQSQNQAYWNLDISNCFVVVSFGPGYIGPVYLFNTRVYNLTPTGAGKLYNTATGTLTGRAFFFKYGNQIAATAAPVFMAHVTGWTNTGGHEGTGAVGLADGASHAGGSGSGTSGFRKWYLWNNIMRMKRYAFDLAASPVDRVVAEDYNAWGTTKTAYGLRINNALHTTIAAWRAATGKGAHSNTFGGSTYDLGPAGAAFIDTQLNDPNNGDLTLDGASVLIEAGMPVPNISDQPDQFSGDAPNVGYQP